MLPVRPRRVGRPLGGVAEALLNAAEAAPDTVRNLCATAGVGYRVGRYTASRMLERGELVKAQDTRPAIVMAPACAAVCLMPIAATPVADALSLAMREGTRAAVA